MIITKMSGGLGNQLFQYGVGRMLANKLNTELYIDRYNPSNKRPYGLSVFNITGTFASLNDIKKWTPKMVKEPHFNHYTKLDRMEGNIHLEGYWQSYKYVESIRDILLEELTIKNNMRRQFELVNDIVSCNSVAVHFRRGDYAKDKHTHAYHGTCPMDYYRTAINRIEQSVENPKYFVFSDDVDWVRKKWPYSLVPEPRFASNYSEVKDYHDMQVMAKCKHNITANSSFSWWGAWLNRNPNKIVISPDQWFKNKEMQNKTHDLIPPTWIRA